MMTWGIAALKTRSGGYLAPTWRLSGGAGPGMADIFISYSKNDHDQARMLAAFLEAEGYSVWWDTNENYNLDKPTCDP
jgi:hypothetical protein